MTLFRKLVFLVVTVAGAMDTTSITLVIKQT